MMVREGFAKYKGSQEAVSDAASWDPEHLAKKTTKRPHSYSLFNYPKSVTVSDTASRDPVGTPDIWGGGNGRTPFIQPF